MPDHFTLQEKSATTQLVKHWWFNKVDMTLASHIAKQTYCYVNFNMKRLSGAKQSKNKLPQIINVGKNFNSST